MKPRKPRLPRKPAKPRYIEGDEMIVPYAALRKAPKKKRRKR